MTDRAVCELIALAKSAKNNMQRKYKGKFNDQINLRCTEFCKDNNIKISHGSAYKEVRHKSYYYINKYVDNLICHNTDLYKLRENHILSDKEIVDRILSKGGK